MTSRIQGEGDYEAARRFNEKTREFVKDKQAAGKDIKASGEQATDTLTPAEIEARKHAKHGEQDKRDADMLKNLEGKP